MFWCHFLNVHSALSSAHKDSACVQVEKSWNYSERTYRTDRSVLKNLNTCIVAPLMNNFIQRLNSSNQWSQGSSEAEVSTLQDVIGNTNGEI